MTIKELKEILKDWPDDDSYDEENEIWIYTSESCSSLVLKYYRLNEGDLLLESGAFI